MKTAIHERRGVIAALVCALLLGSGATAGAARLITGKQIKDGSISAVDLAQSVRARLAVRGPAGPAGLPGMAGPAGAQGFSGTQGPAGPQGVPGTQGTAGVRGSTGPTGSQGPKGDTGAQGTTGGDGILGTASFGGPVGAIAADGTWAFAGSPSSSITIGAGQRLIASGSASLATGAGNGAVTLDYGICVRPAAGGELTVLGHVTAIVVGESLGLFSTSSAGVPGAGSFVVGMCAMDDDVVVGANDVASGWVLVSSASGVGIT